MCHQNAGQNQKRTFVKKNCIKTFGNHCNEHRSDLKLRADYNQVILTTIQFRIFLSCNLLSKNIKIKVHKSAILPTDLYGCE
jgi:hypothetical protein